MNTVVIGLGSNIAPQANIRKVRKILAKQFKVLAESRWVRTKAVEMEGQADFLNGAVLIKTALSLKSLKTALSKIESEMGRPRGHKKSDPRTIDLDVLVVNRRVVHPDVYRRDFIKQSVAELIPELNPSIGDKIGKSMI